MTLGGQNAASYSVN